MHEVQLHVVYWPLAVRKVNKRDFKGNCQWLSNVQKQVQLLLAKITQYTH